MSLLNEYGDLNTVISILKNAGINYKVYRSQLNGNNVINLFYENNNACYSYNDDGKLICVSGYEVDDFSFEYNVTEPTGFELLR